MKKIVISLSIIAVFVTLSCTQGKPGSGGQESKNKKNQPDTGFTGIYNYKNSGVIVKSVEFKNGIKSGMTKTFSRGGMLEQEIPYVDGKRNGVAKWYYPDGLLFRSTPYQNDTVNGPQIQYYKNNKVKARITYVEGKRVPSLDEYEMNGTKVVGYPHLVYRVTDTYKEKGVYKIFVEMSDLSENAKYYRGDFVNGLVDLTICKPLLQTSITGYVDLKKTEGASTDSVVVIGGYLTPYGNRLYSRIAIPLPYKDLQ